MISNSKFQVTIQLTCKISLAVWHITNVYGPTLSDERALFTDWLYNIDTTPLHNWMILGDFNLIRSNANRSRGSGDVNNMLLFNSIISHLELEEIPLKGRAYTWNNMQTEPLLEKLDWIFTSANWTTNFPNTIATPMSNISSDHVPTKIQIGTRIPKANLFRFEDFWLEFEGFSEVVLTN